MTLSLGKDLSTYFKRMRTVYEQLNGTRQAITPDDFMSHAYNMLPEEYNIKGDLEIEKEGASIDSYCSAMLEIERRNNGKTKAMSSTALQTNTQPAYTEAKPPGNKNNRQRTSNRWCTRCQNTSHNTSTCWHIHGKPYSKKNGRKDEKMKCARCGKEGHPASNCPSGNNGTPGPTRHKNNRKEDANVVAEEDDSTVAAH